jgi:hypothetical protein
MFQWLRLPDADAAGTNTNDTTEVQIGTGVAVPTWARSIKALHVHSILLALTTDEDVSGYIRLANDQGTLDPLNFPLPVITELAGAQGGHLHLPLTLPCEHNVTPNDTLRAYAALDSASTGVHTLQAYILFSSQGARFNMKAQKSALVAGSATANTSAGAATIETIAGKTRDLLGCWYYVNITGVTAAQTVGGYVKVASNAAGWMEQRLPTNMLGSGLGTDIPIITRPMFAVISQLREYMDGVSYIPFETPFPVGGRQSFNFTNYMDGTNTNAPQLRYGLIWRE